MLIGWGKRPAFCLFTNTFLSETSCLLTRLSFPPETLSTPFLILSPLRFSLSHIHIFYLYNSSLTVRMSGSYFVLGSHSFLTILHILAFIFSFSLFLTLCLPFLSMPLMPTCCLHGNWCLK